MIAVMIMKTIDVSQQMN